MKELREKATAKSDDYTVILEEILANFVEHKDLLLQLRKKATEIVIIENFFAELKAKNSSESMAMK
ncbi:hypothetical protein D7X33_03735 [Butyricicoccus sp. 1XD8-22]|nr:hypothetical protein D7X33_03735 [Butyricicoccus sp. 1XD8-22]